MLFKELQKLVTNVINFVNGVEDYTKSETPEEREKRRLLLIKYLKKAGIKIEE